MTLTEAILRAHRRRHPLIMGVVNVTPDSFSDGGRFARTDQAVAHGLSLAREGANILDIGGESTRPGARPVEAAAELERVIPVIRGLRAETDCAISIDTSKPEVMRAAIDAGADMINDVNGLRAPGAVAAAASLGVPVCVMHMQGEPRTMQKDPRYRDVVAEVSDFLDRRVEACLEAGMQREQLVIDPGFGFGKTLAHNLALLNGIEALRASGVPVLAGLSRKSMLGAITGRAATDERLAASLAAALLAAQRGAAIVRVHDVADTLDVLKVWIAARTADDDPLQAVE
jgi:dihydropteroate synthase